MRHYCFRNADMICWATIQAASELWKPTAITLAPAGGFGSEEPARYLNCVEYNPAFETPIIGEVFRTVAEGLADTKAEFEAGKGRAKL
jgi:hypothetical protein